MRQNINLYQPVLLRTRHRFSARAMAAGLAVLLLGLGAMGGYGAWQLDRLHSALTRTQAQERRLAAQLEGARARLRRAQDPRLLARLETLERRRREARALLSDLAGVDLDGQGGFSAYLIGLARGHRRGLWIQGLEVADGGRRLVLRGAATAPALLPGYLERLGRQPPYRGLTFQVFEIRRPDPGDGGTRAGVLFHLETGAPRARGRS